MNLTLPLHHQSCLNTHDLALHVILALAHQLVTHPCRQRWRQQGRELFLIAWGSRHVTVRQSGLHYSRPRLSGKNPVILSSVRLGRMLYQLDFVTHFVKPVTIKILCIEYNTSYNKLYHLWNTHTLYQLSFLSLCLLSNRRHRKPSSSCPSCRGPAGQKLW